MTLEEYKKEFIKDFDVLFARYDTDEIKLSKEQFMEAIDNCLDCGYSFAFKEVYSRKTAQW